MDIDEIVKNWAQIEVDQCRKQGLSEKQTRQCIKVAMKELEKIALKQMEVKNE